MGRSPCVRTFSQQRPRTSAEPRTRALPPPPPPLSQSTDCGTRHPRVIMRPIARPVSGRYNGRPAASHTQTDRQTNVHALPNIGYSRVHAIKAMQSLWSKHEPPLAEWLQTFKVTLHCLARHGLRKLRCSTVRPDVSLPLPTILFPFPLPPFP